MIDVWELLVQFRSQILGLFSLEELRTGPDRSSDPGFPMNNVRFHEASIGDTIGWDFFLIIELMSPLMGINDQRRTSATPRVHRGAETV